VLSVCKKHAQAVSKEFLEIFVDLIYPVETTKNTSVKQKLKVVVTAVVVRVKD